MTKAAKVLMKPIPILIIILSCLWGSCDIINPEEKTPTFVHIDSFQFAPTPNTGTASQKITTVWAYFNGYTLGAFDLPATFPVLADAPGTLTVRPGIVYSGINDVLVSYPFFRSDTMTLQPSPGQVIHFTPETSYYGDSVLSITNEDFELGNSFTLVTGDTPLVRVSDPGLVFEGGYSGYIYLNNKKESENIMTMPFTAPVETYLELDYKCNLHFDVGLQSTNSSGQLFTQYLFTYRPRDFWDKIYIGLQDFISQYPNKSYRVVIKVRSETPVTGYVSLDNVKVVSRK
jgi:hypothetical protein